MFGVGSVDDASDRESEELYMNALNLVRLTL